MVDCSTPGQAKLFFTPELQLLPQDLLFQNTDPRNESVALSEVSDYLKSTYKCTQFNLFHGSWCTKYSVYTMNHGIF
jgi:hypothetical protein